MSRLFQIARRCQDLHGVEWFSSDEPVPYPIAVSLMEDRIARIGASELPEAIWLLEHPPLYTAGTSARDDELLSPNRLPVYRTGRGGRYTYHGPGQRVAYVMLDLRRRGADVRAFVHSLEGWIIEALATFGLRCERREGRIGIWVESADGKEAKIAAIGVRVRRWISYHGIAINVSPDLGAFGGIIPCGLAEFDVTSMHALGVPASLADVDQALKRTFPQVFPPAVLEITSLQTPSD